MNAVNESEMKELSKTQQILEMSKDPAMTAEKIADVLKKNKQYVYDVRSRSAAKAVVKRGRGRPKKALAKPVQTMTPVVKVERPNAEIAALKMEIEMRDVVIKYLKEKLRGASI
jgi:hypothetical protein